MKPDSSVLHADSIGKLFTDDPNIGLPTLPRIAPEVLVIPLGVSGVLFAGTKEPQLIKGRSVRTVLPRILEKLNGERTVDDLLEELPFLSRESLVNVISLLYSRGLLEDGSAPPPPQALRSVDAFAGRFLDVTRQNTNRSDVMRRLRNTRLAICGDSYASRLLEKHLSGCGIGFLRCIGQSDLQKCDVNLITGIASSEQEDLTQIFIQAQNRGITGFHIRVARKITQVGPIFIPGLSSCYDCMLRLHGIPAGDGVSDEMEFFVSLAAMTIFQTISLLSTIHTYNGIQEYRQTDSGMKSVLRHTARLPG